MSDVDVYFIELNEETYNHTLLTYSSAGYNCDIHFINNIYLSNR